MAENNDMFVEDIYKIPAAFDVVKYKILECYYRIQEYREAYDMRKSQGEIDTASFDMWFSELKKLFTRVKGKMKKEPYITDYAHTLSKMEDLQDTGHLISEKSLRQLSNRMFDFIDDIGITKIEKREINRGNIITK